VIAGSRDAEMRDLWGTLSSGTTEMSSRGTGSSSSTVAGRAFVTEWRSWDAEKSSRDAEVSSRDPEASLRDLESSLRTPVDPPRERRVAAAAAKRVAPRSGGVACGGTVRGEGSPSPDASPAIDGAAVDAASDAVVGPAAPDCPATEPANGDHCSSDGLLCEYGSDYSPLCNALFVCGVDTWGAPILYNNTPMCPTAPPVAPANPAECYATRADVPAGQACSTPVSCSYDGSQCTCGVYCPSVPVQFPPCDPDAGVTQPCCDTTKVTWNCFDGPQYCRTPRPRLGTPCTAGDSCAIDAPDVCAQTVLTCSMGVWEVAPTGCGAGAAP
jgi:hypothetical protein